MHNKKLKDTLALGSPPKPAERAQGDRPGDLGKRYWLFNLGGLLISGPGLEIGRRVGLETVVGFHIGYPACGALYQYIYYDLGFRYLYLTTIEAGIRLSQFFRMKFTENRLYAGFSLDVGYQWLDALYEEGVGLVPLAERGTDWILRILPHLGYRIRYPSRFFLNLGVSFGFGLVYSLATVDFEKSIYINPHGNLEISIGREF